MVNKSDFLKNINLLNNTYIYFGGIYVKMFSHLYPPYIAELTHTAAKYCK